MKRFLVIALLLLASGFAVANAQGRTVLTADKTYYVATNGNDSNDGSASDPAHAKLTINGGLRALQYVDFGGNNVTISVADGTYPEAVSIGPFFAGMGTLTLQGDTANPANCVISATNGDAIMVSQVTVTIAGFKVQTSGWGQGVYAQNGAIASINEIIFGTCVNAQIVASQFAQVYLNVSYTISGSAQEHIYCTYTSQVYLADYITVTLTGTPAFSQWFSVVGLQSFIWLQNVNFSGSATGARYYSVMNGVLFTGGRGANFLPGNSPGTLGTQGQYL
jgi:hypothetical protein